MKRCSRVFLINFLLLAIALLWGAISADATSWVRLAPEEVDESAELIVYGQYDFSGGTDMNRQYKGIFAPAAFKVEKYYRGTGAERITAGIDPFDIGWVEEIQEEGASFLLFLERDKDNADCLIPVAGPNGMVQIVDGKAQTGDEKEEAYYNNILENTAAVSPASSPRNAMFVFLILLLISGLFTATRKRNGTVRKHRAD